MFTIPVMGSLTNVEPDLGGTTIQLMGCENPIMFYYSKKYNSEIHLKLFYHFSKQFNLFTKEIQKIVVSKTDTKHIMSVVIKNSSGIFSLLKISKKLEWGKFRGYSHASFVTKDVDQYG